MISRVDQAYDYIFSSNFRKRFENFIIYLSIAGFLIHLLLILLYNNELLSIGDRRIELLEDPISAIYTPFSLILVFEVYLLVYFLPKSFSNSIAKQYEVVSLILIRKIFKDIASIEVDKNWFYNPDDLLLTVDMITILLMFFIISRFYRTTANIPKEDRYTDIRNFVRIKERLAVFLILILIGLVLYNFADWTINSYNFSIGKQVETIKLDSLFYKDFFTALILMDVLILIISFKYTEDYYLLIRNSGFVISTILLRIALSGGGMANTFLLLFSVVFGWVILLIYSRYAHNRLAVADD